MTGLRGGSDAGCYVLRVDFRRLIWPLVAHLTAFESNQLDLLN